jgi:pyruvate formate lyase activating enzyme
MTMSGVAFIRTSLIDFPGRLASVLFLPGCDFRCPYCHNAALVEPREGEGGDLVPMGEFLAFLDRRKRLVSGVVLSGGEPLLREELPRLARAIRDRGLAVKLDTNGSHPERIEAVGADYVALDLKTSASRYAAVAPALPEAGARALESLARLRSLGLPFEVRITCAPGILGEAELEELAPALEGGDEVVLQGFRPGGCLDPAFDGVEPYGPEAMARLLEIVQARAPRARIRGAMTA